MADPKQLDPFGRPLITEPGILIAPEDVDRIVAERDAREALEQLDDDDFSDIEDEDDGA